MIQKHESITVKGLITLRLIWRKIDFTWHGNETDSTWHIERNWLNVLDMEHKREMKNQLDYMIYNMYTKNEDDMPLFMDWWSCDDEGNGLATHY